MPLLARKQCFHADRAAHSLRASRGRRLSGRAARAGFSLLEIVLALAILAGSMAVLGEVVRNSMQNARIARDLTDAQLYCESKLAELEAGLLSTDNVSDMPIEPMVESMLESDTDMEDASWLYSIQTELIDEEGLIQVSLSVSQDPTTTKTPVTFTITRMMLDESLMSTETEDSL